MNDTMISLMRNSGYTATDDLVDDFVSEIEDLENKVAELEGKVNDLESELEEAQKENDK